MPKAMTARSLIASTSVAAGGSNTGTALDVRAGFGMMVTARVTNGSTGPTIACTFKLEISNDNTNFRTFVEATAQTGNNVVTSWAIDVPATVMYIRAAFSGHTGQAVTVEAIGHEWTTLT